jgi:hypothetical protein
MVLQLFFVGERRKGLKHALLWWRDIWRLGNAEEGGWFGNPSYFFNYSIIM